MEAFQQPYVIWVFVAMALFLMEFAIPGLIVFFFGVGALVVAVCTYFFDLHLNVQLMLFILSSVILLFGLRRWLKNIFTGQTRSSAGGLSDRDEFVGERTVVKEAIRRHVPGKVELHGTDWRAEAEEDIEAGAIVEIIGRRNIALVVKRI